MSNLLLAHTPNDTATLDGGSWTLPLTNLKTEKLSQVARSATDALADTVMRIDQGSNKSARVFGLFKHNLSASALWRVRYSQAPFWVDLSQDRLDSRITFTRSTTRTYYGADGLRATAAVNEWPIEYHPTTLERKSRITWPSRTNLWLQSGDQGNASTTKTNVTITSNDSTGADGTTSMDKLVEAAGAGMAPRIHQTFTPTVGSQYSLSADAKADERNFVLLILGTPGFGASSVTACFNLSTGAITTNGVGTSVQTNIEQLQGGIWRCSLTAVATDALASAAQIRMTDAATTSVAYTYTGDGTSGLFVDAIQLEVGLPSPYIATTTTTVTRGQDQPRVSSLTDIYTNGQSVTLAVKQEPYSTGSRAYSGHLLTLSNAGSTSNCLRIFRSSGGTTLSYACVVGGVTQAGGGAINSGALSAVGASQWAVASFATDNFKASAGGVAVVTDSLGAMPTVTVLDIGWAGSTCGECYLYEVLVASGSNNSEVLSISTSGPTALTDSYYDSGWVSALQMTLHDTYGSITTTWGQQHPVLLCPATAVTGRYCEIDINDTSNAAGYVEAGRLFIADGLQPAVNADWNLAEGYKDFSTILTAAAGQETYKERHKQRTVTFTLPELSTTESDHLHQIDRWMGLTGEVVYVPDPTDAARNQQYGFLGLLSELSALEYPKYNIRKKNLRITEKL